MVLVGPSGCGKTTTLRMVNRLVEPTGGRVLLDGRDVAQARPAALRRGIGYVIQEGGLFPHRTVEDNIATVPRLNGWRRAMARARARELMDLVGLDLALARRYPRQLSGGQQQRVGVARALAADPPVLLMDEPFSAVDPIVRVIAARRAAQAAGGAAQDRRAGHARCGRGDQGRGPGGGLPPGRARGPARHAGAAARRSPRTTMWRALSDLTGGSAGFPSFPLIVWIWAWRLCSGSRPPSPRRCRPPRASVSRGFWSLTQNAGPSAGLPPRSSSCSRGTACWPASR